jgi:hypothetical protein
VTKPRGYALCVGVNSVDPLHYQGWSGPLNACENDARDMASLLKRRGFDVEMFTTPNATRDAVIDRIRDIAEIAKCGDVFAFTSSSHGGQLPDLNGDEPDGMDETLCLFDGEIVDDELADLWSEFKAGVRIVSVIDSCHSGTVARLFQPHASSAFGPKPVELPKSRALPIDVAERTYRANQEFYDPILSDPDLKESKKRIKASVLHIGACQDNQTASDGVYNGLFTGTLLATWQGGRFRGSYTSLHKQISRRMPAAQTPNLYWASARNADFEAQQPFTI